MKTDSVKVIQLADPDEKERLCLEILRELPDWFGLPDAVVSYGREVREMDVFVAGPDGLPTASFVALHRHYPECGEIHVMGVRPGFHRQGLGRLLVEVCERRLREDGGRFLMVKTLGPSHPDPHYAKTRDFYLQMGFQRLEETRDLWEGNPCLVLVKVL